MKYLLKILIPTFEQIVTIGSALGGVFLFWKGWLLWVKERSLGRELAKKLNDKIDQQHLEIEDLKLKNNALSNRNQELDDDIDRIFERQEKILDLLMERVTL